MSKTGIELIAEERAKQISDDGYSPAHDDRHNDGEIAVAGGTYALPQSHRIMGKRTITIPTARGLAEPDGWKEVSVSVPCDWPWEPQSWKPTPNDRVRELVKAGALIAAEIDRLQRSAVIKPHPSRGKEPLP